jgi:DNA-directed RNA polymerase I, II, and III subunit RPABC5
MLIPVRCKSCGKVLGNKETKYNKLLCKGHTPNEALDMLGIIRDCCRRDMTTYVDVNEILLKLQDLEEKTVPKNSEYITVHDSHDRIGKSTFKAV